MKKPFLSLILCICLTVAASVLNAQSDERGMWIWTLTDEIINDYFDDNGTSREELLSFIAAPHGDPNHKITRLYMSAYNYLRYQPKKMRRFLADMNYRGISIYVVLSDPRFALPDKADPGDTPPYNLDKAYNQKFMDMIEFYDTDTQVRTGIIPFLERTALNHEKLTGIMLDIEPHLLGSGNFAEVKYAWDLDDGAHDFPVIWHTYLTGLQYCRDKIDEYNINYPDSQIVFSDACPAFFDDKYNPSHPQNSLTADVLDKVDFYTVMAYNDNQTFVRNISAGEIAEAAGVSKKCVITLETTKNIRFLDDIADALTFWEEGYVSLENTITYLKSNFASSPGFDSISIHSYADNDTPLRGYQHLTPSGPGNPDASGANAPVITLRSPNGFLIDGVDFSAANGMQIAWEAFIPQTQSYKVELCYALESQRNHPTLWQSQVFFSQTYSAPSSANQMITGSYTWNPPSDVKSIVDSVSGQRDGILIFAKITYISNNLSSFDTTDYGLAVNEGDFDWSPPLKAAIDPGIYENGNYQSLQMLADKDANLHAVWYVYWPAAQKGIYYAFSSDFGETWTTPELLSVTSDMTDSNIAPKPAFDLRDDYAVVVWREETGNAWPTLPLVELDIALGTRSATGKITWQSSQTVNTGVGNCVDINSPDVALDANGSAHVVWQSFRTSWYSYIDYAKFTYVAPTWTQTEYRPINVVVHGNNVLRTPSIALSGSGQIHVVWGLYHPVSPHYMSIQEKSFISGVWGDSVTTVFTHSYTSDQRFTQNADYPPNVSPIYLPKIKAKDDVLYLVWQLTTLQIGDLNNDLPASDSRIYFAKRGISDTTWTVSSSPIAANGYAPDLSLWDNDGSVLTSPIVQVVYSNDFQVYAYDKEQDGTRVPVYEGKLNFIESADGGTTWTAPDVFAQNDPVDNDGLGIRLPYMNNSFNGEQGWHIFSYPFIFTSETGITTTCWVNAREEEGTGIIFNNDKIFRSRNKFVVTEPNPPFVNLTDQSGNFRLSWNIPQTNGIVPSGYYLRRVTNNDFANTTILNDGNPIRQLNFIDNDSSIAAGNYYRYQLRYAAGATGQSFWSNGSNAIKVTQDLYIEDFENDSNGDRYSDITRFKYGSIPDSLALTDLQLPLSQRYAGDSGDGNCLRVTFDNDSLTNPQYGAGVALIFPTVMDFSDYGSIDLAIKFNNVQPGAQARDITISVAEAESEEGFEMTATIANDSNWHELHLFFDEARKSSPAVDETNNITNVLELDRIQSLNINVYGPPNTSFFIDGIRLNKTPFVDIKVDPVINAFPIGNNGTIKGEVLNPSQPVEIEFGNAADPYYLLIYSDGYMVDSDGNYVLDNEGKKIPVENDGLINTLMTGADDPHYNIPIKVWTKSFGPVRFSTSAYPAGYPPTQGFFWRGYNFNRAVEELENDSTALDTFDFYDNESGSFVEGTDEGEYAFDLDGDGFSENDDYFADDPTILLAESPAWLFLPFRDTGNPAVEPDNDAIVMYDYDDTTWRVLASSSLGSNAHRLELYFAAYIGLKQTMYSFPQHQAAYGTFSTRIYFDLINN